MLGGYFSSLFYLLRLHCHKVFAYLNVSHWIILQTNNDVDDLA